MSDLLIPITDDQVIDHDHEFAGPPEDGAIRMCVDRRCVYTAVGTGTEWRDPTPEEQTKITLFMWQDVIVAEAMQIIHGPEAGLRRARYLLGQTDHE
jgi:hypothetical protein